MIELSAKTLLMSKYQNAIQLCDRMTQPIPYKRLNCEEILQSKHLWALDKNELIIDDHMRHDLEEKSKDKQSIYHIINRKLNYS